MAIIKTDSMHYDDIVDALNEALDQNEKSTPDKIAGRIESIPKTAAKSYGREVPTLEFDKTEILFDVGSTTTSSVKVTTNSDGAISVESKDPKTATAKMTGKDTFEVSSVSTATEKDKGEISVMVAAGTTHRRVMGSLPVIYKVLPKASLNPVSSVSYTDGLDGLTPAEISAAGMAISKNAEILNTTTVVYFDFGAIHRKISCGKEGYTQVSMPLNGTTYKFNVIGFNHDPLTNASAYGSTTATSKAGITFQMADCFNTQYPMNSTNTNAGGWDKSIMRTQTMPLLKGYMPSEWQSIIKPVNKISGVGGGASSGLQTTSDELFLLSEGEIFGSAYGYAGSGYAFDDEVTATPQYPWYSADNVNGRRVKNCNGSACSWWERSASSGSSNSFCGVISDGSAATIGASYSLGVPFGFCV